jgi:hypothetical protein
MHPSIFRENHLIKGLASKIIKIYYNNPQHFHHLLPIYRSLSPNISNSFGKLFLPSQSPKRPLYLQIPRSVIISSRHVPPPHPSHPSHPYPGYIILHTSRALRPRRPSRNKAEPRTRSAAPSASHIYLSLTLRTLQLTPIIILKEHGSHIV